MDQVVTFELSHDSIKITSVESFAHVYIGIDGKTEYADCFVSVQTFTELNVNCVTTWASTSQLLIDWTLKNDNKITSTVCGVQRSPALTTTG